MFLPALMCSIKQRNETKRIESNRGKQSTKKQKKNGQENMDDYVDKYV